MLHFWKTDITDLNSRALSVWINKANITPHSEILEEAKPILAEQGIELEIVKIEDAVKALLINGERLIRNPFDIDARSETQWLASIAHNNLLDTGRIADWGSHRIEHELSAQYGITHGEGMAVVLVAWTRYIYLILPCNITR